MLATKAFAHTARYDGLVSAYLSRRTDEASTVACPDTSHHSFKTGRNCVTVKTRTSRLLFMLSPVLSQAGIAAAEQLQGKELSYNNINDADAALECVNQFDQQPACVIVKHANPCGVAMGNSNTEAYLNAFATDPVSSFGGIIAFNQLVTARSPRQSLTSSLSRS